jgi:hypothetical protein
MPNAARMRPDAGVAGSTISFNRTEAAAGVFCWTRAYAYSTTSQRARRYSSMNSGNRIQRLRVLRSMPATRAASAWFLSASKAAMAASFFRPNLLPCPFI